MKILFAFLIAFVAFLIYEIYQFEKEYKIVKKFSINNGENIEYYFVLKQKITRKIFKIQISKEIYDLHNYNDHISIF